MKLIETYNELEKEEKNKEIVNFLNNVIFNGGLKRTGGGYGLLFWEWAPKKSEIKDSNEVKFVYKLRTTDRPIRHGEYEGSAPFIINKKYIDDLSAALEITETEASEILINWFIENIYNDPKFKEEYINSFERYKPNDDGKIKWWENIDTVNKIQTKIDDIKNKKRGNQFYNELLGHIKAAVNNQKYYYDSIFWRQNEEWKERHGLNESAGETVKIGDVLKTIKDSYTATGKYKDKCDELHAFESTSDEKKDEKGNIIKDQDGNPVRVTYTIGGVHTKIQTELYSLYKQGYNPKISKFEITVNNWTVNWTATIVQSDNAYVGFTSRGSGCNATRDGGLQRTNTEKGKSENEVKENIQKKIGKVGVIELLTDLYGMGGDGTYFHQRFWVYTLPEKYPTNKNKVKSDKDLINPSDANF